MRQSISGHNTLFVSGFYTALNKDILLCPDDAPPPLNFTPFLTPLLDNNATLKENVNLLKLAVEEKFEQEDLAVLTKVNVTLPKTTQELKELCTVVWQEVHWRGFNAIQQFGHGSRTYQGKRAFIQLSVHPRYIFWSNFLVSISWKVH